MALGYTYQSNPPVVLIGSKSGTTLTSVVLTDAYGVANKTVIFETKGMSKINLSTLYTMGASETTNSIQWRIETSADRTNWYRLPNESVSAGTSTLTVREFTYVGVDGAASSIGLPLDTQDLYMRVSVKESGVSSAVGSVYMEVVLSGGK